MARSGGNGAGRGASDGALLDMPVEQLQQHVAEIRKELRDVGRRMGRPANMTSEQRIHTTGRLRSDEPEIMASIYDMMDGHSQHFMALAPKDGGRDPRVLETGPARDDLARREILLPLLGDLDALRDGIGDTVLRAAERARALSSAAYQIALANEAHDAPLQSALARAKSYYGDNARRGAKKRKAKAEADAEAKALARAEAKHKATAEDGR